MTSRKRLLRRQRALTMIPAPPVKAGGWGVETSAHQLGRRINGAGWHARMSSRLAGKGACACDERVSNIRLRPPSPRGT